MLKPELPAELPGGHPNPPGFVDQPTKKLDLHSFSSSFYILKSLYPASALPYGHKHCCLDLSNEIMPWPLQWNALHLQLSRKTSVLIALCRVQVTLVITVNITTPILYPVHLVVDQRCWSVFVFHILKYSCKKYEDIEEEGPSGGEAMLGPAP